MSKPGLRFEQFSALLRAVFGLGDHERALTIFIDLPDAKVPDTPAWIDRRRIATDWFTLAMLNAARLPFSAIQLCAYNNVGTNNGDLPDTVQLVESSSPALQGQTPRQISLREVLENTSVVLSLTELSATAPLKLLGRHMLFRGATLPGFTRQMIPALGLNYERVNARVLQFTDRLKRAEGATIDFSGAGKAYSVYLDLRFRLAHASGGLIREAGTVANLPSGEAYIVPYEGERTGEPTRTKGLLPVQFGDEIVVFRIEGNRAVEVVTHGNESEKQQSLLARDPAYGNIAELGIGVLGEWGVVAVGSTLLDEKLGVHIAFGRSDHFGGITSPATFRSPANVIHVDWVYVPSVQPLVRIERVLFAYPDGVTETVMRLNKYVV